MYPNQFNTIGNYTCIAYREKVSFQNIGDFLLIIYGAYDAKRLISFEGNGIAILSETHQTVFCDEIAIADTGYFGPTLEQLNELARLKAMSESEFVQFINYNFRSRFKIEIGKQVDLVE